MVDGDVFGVNITGAPEGGDFDCVASFRDMLLYLEVKSGDKLKLGDKPCQTYIERAKVFELMPPPPGWEGVFEMTSK